MSIITKALKGVCVYWAPTGFDQYGQPTLGSPKEMACRWADVIQQAIDKEGTLVESKGSVMVGEDLEVGGVLMNGKMTDIVYAEDPKRNSDAYEIIQFINIPNLKQTEYVRVALL